jgi:hypothetical protein
MIGRLSVNLKSVGLNDKYWTGIDASDVGTNFAFNYARRPRTDKGKTPGEAQVKCRDVHHCLVMRKQHTDYQESTYTNLTKGRPHSARD